MRFKKLKDVIDFSRELHSQLGQQYAELEQLATSERARMMLDYLQRHERHLAETLKQYEDEAANGIIETWMQAAPELHLEDLVNKVRDVPLNNVEAIVATALEVDDCLVKIYRDIAENSDLGDIKELAQNLMQLENSEEHKISRNAFRLSDM